MKQLIIIAHNLRSAHNVGSLLRTAEGLGIDEVLLTGYTPFPALQSGDPRLPHEQIKVSKLIQKTALGAELSQNWRRVETIEAAIAEFKQRGFTIAALEQTSTSIALPDYTPSDKLALILGREVEGVESEVLASCDITIEIPMLGKKESFNVVQAAAMAMYQLKLMV